MSTEKSKKFAITAKKRRKRVVSDARKVEIGDILLLRGGQFLIKTVFDA